MFHNTLTIACFNEQFCIVVHIYHWNHGANITIVTAKAVDTDIESRGIDLKDGNWMHLLFFKEPAMASFGSSGIRIVCPANQLS